MLEQAQAWRRTAQQSRYQEKDESRFDIFDVVSHYFNAAELVTDEQERLLVAQLSLKAAIKGKNSMGTSASH